MLVGLVVMPMAILPEVFTEWPLGKDICFLWVTSDVTLCTCSILHIMMIAIDRYCIITSPMSYEMKYRTKKLIAVYILIAWVVSILISMTPAAISHPPDYGKDGRGCKVNQSIGYQMYATFVAFYLPLIVKLCLYGKLFMLSRKLVKAEAKNHPHLGYQDSSCDDQNSTPSGHTSCRESPIVGVKNGVNTYKSKDLVNATECVPLNSTLHVGRHLLNDVITRSHSVGENDLRRDKEKLNNNKHISVYHSQHLPVVEEGSKTSTHKGPISMAKRLSIAASTRLSRLLHPPHEHRNTPKSNMAAIRTLGAIMGLFTVCWLPFFVLAVVGPLCPTCEISPTVYSVFLWIGYANSCFNPFIYAQFNREFRTPFKEILRCHCRTVDDSVRHSDYIYKYGGENEH
ncbi:5-hydroxytryptamine receptor 1D-like [Watersipora subatra]|uniref:5-hydroxytryptamine receptor 1D-like n=1 Tax=Watersipora subatra TaxID=2589382 RepID=UPI00355ADB75